MTARRSVWTARFARRAYLSGALGAAGLVAAWLDPSPYAPGWLAIRTDGAGLLYAAAALVGGANFAWAWVRAVRTLRLDMNFLMGTAIVAAILVGEPFEAATLAFLFSIAELLERFAVDRSRRAVTDPLALTPEQADRLREDGTVETLPVAALRPGDRIRVRAGDRIGADGRVLEGAAAVNEAAITGESLPRAVEPGDTVYSGSLSTDGALDIEVTADAGHSVLARVVELVRAAEGRRAPIEQFVQRFARVYTPGVTALALLVIVMPPALGLGDWLDWFMRGITLLVVACPCALVIATPVTVVSALTSAARHGVLIKGGEHLERLGAVRALATDKTGTLTTGRLELTRLKVLPAANEQGMLRLLATLEARSEHPVGEAIVRFAAARGIVPGSEVVDFKSHPGKGVVGRVDGVLVVAGTERLVGETDAALLGGLEAGAMHVYATTDTGTAAVVTLVDGVRPEAPDLVPALHKLGVRPVVLLTGDRREVAETVGGFVGVDEVRARLLPEDKLAAIQELQRRYGSVAMIGDGINDAPALAEASVGIAMGAVGSPATIETADVALMADDLRRVPYAIALARRSRRTVRFNIAAALLLKLVLAAGAILGVVNLAVAVVAGDMGGSLLVTLNAMRLGALHPPDGAAARPHGPRGG